MNQEPPLSLLSDRLLVLGNLTRLRLLGVLALSEVSVSQAADILGLSTDNCGHNLGILHHNGLALRRKSGKYTLYSLNTINLNTILETLTTLLKGTSYARTTDESAGQENEERHVP